MMSFGVRLRNWIFQHGVKSPWNCLARKVSGLIFLTGVGLILSGYFNDGSCIQYLEMEMLVSRVDSFQVFYNQGSGFCQLDSRIQTMKPLGSFQKVRILLPPQVRIKQLRLDPGTQPGRWFLRSVTISNHMKKVRWAGRQLIQNLSQEHDMAGFRMENQELLLESKGQDPYLLTTAAGELVLSGLQDEKRYSGLLMVRWLFLNIILFLSALSGGLLFSRVQPLWMKMKARSAAIVPWGLAGIAVAIATPVFLYIFSQIVFCPRLLHITFKAGVADYYQVFYDTGQGFNQQESVFLEALAGAEFQTLTFILPEKANIQRLRIDPGSSNCRVELKSIKAGIFFHEENWDAQRIREYCIPTHDISDMPIKDGAVSVGITGNDPIFLLTRAGNRRLLAAMSPGWPNTVMRWVWILVGDAFVFVFVLFLMIPRPGAQGVFIGDKWVVVVFAALLVTPVLGRWVLPTWDSIGSEKRAMNREPQFKMENAFNYLPQFQNYFNDTFGFRNWLIRWNNLIRLQQGKANWIKRVVIGKQGWLYYNLRYDYPGRDHASFTQLEFEKICANLERQKTWLAQRGIAFFVMVPPNKSNIYPEYLPAYYKKVPRETRLQECSPYFQRRLSFPILNPTPELLAHKRDFPLYYKVDLHWNGLGGFIGYQVLLREMQKKYPPLKPLGWDDLEIEVIAEQSPASDDLAEMLNAKGQWQDTLVKVRIKNGPVVTPGVGGVIVFHDSLGNALIPYLQYNFKQIKFIHHNFESLEKQYALIEKEKPEIVIYELGEMRMDLLNY